MSPHRGDAQDNTSGVLPTKRITELDLAALLPQLPPDPLIVPGWGTVTAVTPALMVRMDGPCLDADGNTVDCSDPGSMPTPSVGAFTALTSGLLVDDRVWTVLVGRQLIVVGKFSDNALSTELGPNVDLNTLSTTESVVTRQNLFPRPRTTVVTDWQPRQGWTLSASTATGPIPGTGYVVVTAPATLTGVSRGINFYQAPGSEPWTGTPGLGLPVTPGDTLTFSAYMYSSKAGTFQASVRFFNDAGAASVETFGSPVSGSANTWTRINISIAVPAGATHVCGAFQVTNSVAWVTGDFIRVAAMLVEESGTLNPYFDGTNKGVGNPGTAAVEWDGTPDNSTSNMLMPNPNGGIVAIYTQGENAQALTTLNYPEALAGLLEVFTNPGSVPAGNMIWQRYTPYGANADHFWLRGNYNGTWYPWTRFGASGSGDELGGDVLAGTWYWKKADGELICRGQQVFSLTANVGYIYNWVFPQAFIDPPKVAIMPISTVPQNISVSINTLLTDSVDLRLFRTSTAATTFQYEAKGRWK